MEKTTIPTPPRTATEIALATASTTVIEQCTKAVIDSDQALANAADLGKFAKLQLTKLEEERKAIVQPLNGVVDHVNSRFKALTNPLSSGLALLRSKIELYQRAVAQKAEQDRRIAQELARQQAEEMAAIGDTQGAQEIEEQIASPVRKMPEMKRGSFGSVGTSKRLEITITDAALIPREYLVPDLTAIKNDCRAGYVIPGVKAEYVESAVFR